MEYLKNIFNNSNNESSHYSVVDVFNKTKYFVTKYVNFLTNITTFKEFHLAEIPLYPSPILVDIDIKKKGKFTEEKLYNEELIKSTISEYINVLDKHLKNIPENYKILLLEKPAKYQNGFTKNGFHLHFISLSLNKKDLKFVYDQVKKNFKYSEYLDDVHSKPWLLYGATKQPGDLPYTITNLYVVKNKIIEQKNYIEEFIGEKFDNIEITNKNIKTLIPAMMSIRCSKNFSVQIPNEIIDFENQDEENNQSLKVLKNPQVKYINISNEKIGEIVLSLNDNRAEIYDEWIKIAMILTSISKNKENSEDFFKGIFHLFSKKSSNYCEISCDQKWDSLMKTSNNEGGVGIGTLIYLAKEDGNFNFKDFGYNFNISKIPTNDYDIADMVKSSIQDLYITHKEYGCYMFESTIWKEISGWDGVFKRYIKKWFEIYDKNIKPQIDFESEVPFEKEKVKSYKILQKKIKSYSGMNNISKSLFDLYFDDQMDLLFTQKKNIAFKNCVFDVDNWKIIQPDPKHYFITRIEHDLSLWDEVDNDKKEFVYDFFEKLFPDKELREYNIKNFASFLTGKNNFKQFQFWTGDGNNGKSACITLMENIFNRYCMKIPKTMITGITQKQGGANPELFRLKDARIAIIDEVTENDFLDPGQIKGLTGNDKLYGRDLYQRSKDINEISPMFFPILITNEVPIIKKPDTATWGRIRLINFESTFTQNVEKYQKKFPNKKNIYKIDPKMHDYLKENSKYFLSYFIKILFSFNSFKEFNDEEILPKKVIEGLEKFKEGQNVMRRYLEENFYVNSDSTEIFSMQKLLKEYNNTRPKIVLSIQELEQALQLYSKQHPKVTISGYTVKGLSRVDF